MEKYRNILHNHKLPPLPVEGVIGDMRWVMSSDDWWIKIDEKWFWLRGDTKKEWMSSPYGPDHR
jgi:hypothetical protein